MVVQPKVPAKPDEKRLGRHIGEHPDLSRLYDQDIKADHRRIAK
jgi:hypothetical protein